MITFLARMFIRDREQVKDPAVRRQYGMLCGCVGVGLNVLLFLGKLLAGTVSGSIAITADAFNNLSDAGSSLVTMLGFRLAGQKPDPGHPFGHGRFEYISGLIVAMAILLMGFELGKSSVEKILHPESVRFSALAVVILLVSVAVKLYMWAYNRSIGGKIDSAAMKATAADSLSDAVATTAVLLATLCGHLFQWNIDGWAGAVVSLFILLAGVGAARDTISPLLGSAPDPQLVRDITETVLSFPEISGVHDMAVHDYGPGRLMVSLHAEVPADGDLLTLHDAIDRAEIALREKFGGEAVIHMDPIATHDAHVVALREKMSQLVHAVGPRLSIHDFRVVEGPSHTNLIFDVACPFDLGHSDEEVARQIQETVSLLDGSYSAVLTIDRVYVPQTT